MLTVDILREPPEAMAALRRAMTQGFACGNPVRDEAYRQALSATVWRLMHFGIEDGFAYYRARDLANFSLIAEGSATEILARSAYTRGLVEADQALIDALEAAGIAKLVSGWHHHLSSLGEQDVLTALASFSGEELHVGRLLTARRFPHLIQPNWLWDIPLAGENGLPLVAYHLAACHLVLREDLREPTASYLAQHRAVLLCREPDDLLIPLVLRSSATPQTVLAPFAGCYGEPTIIASAAWHLEHRQPREAWELAHTIRPLSRHADDAWTIAGLAAVELGRFTDAERLRLLILDQPGRDRLLLAIAEAQPEAVPTDRLAQAALACPTSHPELFYRLLKALLQRRAAQEARAIAQARRGDFDAHESLGPILATILA